MRYFALRWHPRDLFTTMRDAGAVTRRFIHAVADAKEVLP
jgi:hypothetical protein